MPSYQGAAEKVVLLFFRFKAAGICLGVPEISFAKPFLVPEEGHRNSIGSLGPLILWQITNDPGSNRFYASAIATGAGNEKLFPGLPVSQQGKRARFHSVTDLVKELVVENLANLCGPKLVHSLDEFLPLLRRQ